MELPIPSRQLPDIEVIPPKLTPINLPPWAGELGVDGEIIVPFWAYQAGRAKWQDVDWIAVAFWYMENLAERAFESKHGPIHSYSFRLKGWDPKFWNNAWVNRIALFLRRWSAHIKKKDEFSLHGPLPSYEIKLTHDVDAVSKTIPIRAKQTTFQFYNAIRKFFRGKPGQSLGHFRKGFQFLYRSGNYWCFETIRSMERIYNLSSTFNFYAGKSCGVRSIREWLMDPCYDIQNPRLVKLLSQLKIDGCSIGLHPSFDAWKDFTRISREKENLEKATGFEVKTCRQHWLRFSFEDTWKNQQACGIKEDTTLGFNDRSGFRNGCALFRKPWDPIKGMPYKLDSIPMILMDSHIFDYHDLTESDRKREILKWVREIKDVRGQCSVIWHQRVFSKDYSWAMEYGDLLRFIS